MEQRLSYELASWRVTATLPLILALLPQNPGDVIEDEDHQADRPDCEGEGSQRVGVLPATGLARCLVYSIANCDDWLRNVRGLSSVTLSMAAASCPRRFISS